MRSNWSIVGIAALTAAFGILPDVAAAKPGGPHSVLKSYIASGDPKTTLTQGQNVVSEIDVGCPSDDATCTLVLMDMDQVCGAGAYSWEIVVEVDGTYVGSPDSVPATGNDCGGVTWMGSAVVGPGRHRVEFITGWPNSLSGVKQGYWTANYTVTTP
jgi:hypothetical protein